LDNAGNLDGQTEGGETGDEKHANLVGEGGGVRGVGS